MICHKILTAELLRPSKLRLRLETKHPQHVGKDRSVFSRQELNMKRHQLDGSGLFLSLICFVCFFFISFFCVYMLCFCVYFIFGVHLCSFSCEPIFEFPQSLW